MGKTDIPVYKKSLFSWLLTVGIRIQIILLVVVVITALIRVIPLELQKRIIDKAIGNKNLHHLWTYCTIYLVAVLSASGLKWVINVLQAIIGQRALANMRKALYHHLITLPMNFYRKTQSGMVVSALVTEIASAGDFLGMAVAMPLVNILTLIFFAIYLFTLNPYLAGISFAVYPMVLMIVPRLQKSTNKWNRRRVDATRSLSNTIAESVSGIHEIHGNAAYGIENSKFDSLVDRLLRIRVIWNIYRNSVKVLNNFLNNLSPVLIFIIGGYLAIHGRLDLGALVAFLSAQEKLTDPWKEIMDTYQAYQEASVRYHRTMEYFAVDPEHKLLPEGREPYDLSADIEIKDLVFSTETGIHLLNGIDLSLQPGEQLALVGFSGSGKSTLALCVGQLYKYNRGHLYFGDKEVADLTKKDMVNNMGFVSQSPFIFTGTIEENLLYSCAARNGTTDLSQGSDMPDLDDMIQTLQQTGLFVDVLRFGLNTILDPEKDREMAEILVRIREDFQRDFGVGLARYVEFFDQDRYLNFSSVAENLFFGASRDKDFLMENLAENEFFKDFLENAQISRPLLALGAELAKETVDILGHLPPDDMFYEQSPFGPDELDLYKELAERLKRRKIHDLEDTEKDALLSLGLRFVPGRHKMAGFPGMLENLILEGRALFMEEISQHDPGAFSFYDTKKYIFSQTILNNILFGKTKTEQPDAMEKIHQSIIQLLVAEDLLETIVETGMKFHVGSKGDRLSGGQRQKLAIARVFLKEPDLLIMDEATSALDNNSQARIQNLLETKWKGRATLIAVVHRLDIIKNYDKVAVMKAGKIVEMGAYDQLMAKKGMLYELVHGKS